jgi:ATPase subunit of ABC transporter with duplicated ATPase domains
LARTRILNARGLGALVQGMAENSLLMGDPNEAIAAEAMRKYGTLSDRFDALGGYAAEAEAAAIASNLKLPDRILDQPLKTLSGGQRRRIELARILFSGADTMLLDEPTNHLDADSVTWLREFLKGYQGGLIVISHDVELVGETVNRVFYLDANRQVIDIYNMNWKNYQKQREQDEQRRKRERANAEQKATTLQTQAAKMGARASGAVAAKQMARRAETLLAGLDEVRQSDKVAKLRFPDPAPCGKTPLMATDLSRSYGSLEIFTAVDLAIDRGSRVVILGFNGAGKTTLLRILAGVDEPDTGEVIEGHGLKVGYYAQEHETLDPQRSVLENMLTASGDMNDAQVRSVLGSFLFSGDAVSKPAGVLSGGEKTRLSLAMLVVSAANVLLLDEPTNNLDPASRAEILDALHDYEGSVVLVTHDEGAVTALAPERVLLLPDGVEDLWNEDYLDLISLA